MSFHRGGRSELLGRPKRTHRSQFHIHRIVGDLPPEECLPLAIASLWSMIAREMGIDVAENVGLGNISVEERRVVLRIWTPLDHGDAVARLPMTFDDADWHDQLGEICWRRPDPAAKEMRRRAIELCRRRTADAAKRIAVVEHEDDHVLLDMDDGDATSSRNSLLRLSVPWEKSRRTPDAGRPQGYETISAFLQSACSGLLRTSPGSMRVVGTMEQPSSTSLVVEIPHSLAHRIEGLASSVRITRFSADDLEKVDRTNADSLATDLGCRVHQRRRTDPQHLPAVARDGTREQGIAAAREALTRERTLRPTRSDPLHRAWRLMVAVLDLLMEPFVLLGAAGGGRGEETSRVLDHAPSAAGPWTLLARILPAEATRIASCEVRCTEFERVAKRWGDARSAETSSSVAGLLDRLGAEMADVVEWSSPQEAAEAAAAVLDTIEKLGVRAEEERLRLTSGLRGRLDTTRRFVELKLEDSDLASLPDLRQAS